MSLIRPLTLCILFAAVAAAQTCVPSNLTSTFAAGNGQNGNMFDLQVIGANPVTVCGLDVHIQALGSAEIVEIYAITTGGTYVGNETNAAAWTLLGSAPVTGAGTGVPTTVPLALGVTLLPGSQRGFYVTVTGGGTLAYTNGTAVGSPISSDANIAILTGVGKSYPFGATFSPRNWNGQVRYCIGAGASCPVAPAAPFEGNSAVSSLDIDGVQTNRIAPAITSACIGGTAIVTAATSAPGSFAEILVTLGSLVGGPNPPALLTASGSQVLNIDVTNPTLLFLFGGAVPSFTPHPGSLVLPLTAPAALLVSAQQVVIDPTNVDGFDLSQGATLDVQSGTGFLAGPVNDDDFVEVIFGAPPFCATQNFNFYGTSYDRAYVIDNGRLTFGAPDVDFFADALSAATFQPMLGVWSDLDPLAGGAINISQSATGEYVIDYSVVPYFFSPETATFSLALDPGAGTVTFSGLTGIQVDSGGSPQFIGLSPGGVGPGAPATDPGAVNYLTLGGSTTNATDMIYAIGLAGTLTSDPIISLSTIIFVPNAAGNYDWAAF